MWEIKEQGFQKDKIIHHGNQFLTGHLKLGVRGTLDEYAKNELVGINLPLVYDQVGDGWREPINAFNPLYTTIKINGKHINVLEIDPVEHEQVLNIQNGVMSRKTVFIVDGITITIKSSRFVSYVDERAILGTYEVTVNQDAQIDIMTGIDADVWDIHGPHLENINLQYNQHLVATGISHEQKTKISCLKHIKPHFESDISQYITKNLLLQQMCIKAKREVTYTFEQYAVIGVNQKEKLLNDNMEILVQDGYEKRLQKHQHIWDKKWEDADVVIEGNDDAQLALRYSIYHLIILSPDIYQHASIPARGISGQTYKGAVFWDTEIFMLPFYLNTNIESAKRIIEYRIQGLSGAKQKAQSYGFRGAFYAWESQEDGYDACTDYNVTDVFTNRLVRTYFKDKQIHISGDIVYAIDSYINRTLDYQILKQGALELILEVARFYLDYGHYAPLKNRFELWDVMGPDEYHERVHNNAFTNQLVAMVFHTVLDYKDYYDQQHDHYFDDLSHQISFDKEIDLIKKYVNQIYLKEILDNQLIEQFDGYFKLKDISKEVLFNSKLHEHEYLGGHGLAGDTQIIKQADVMTMLYMFKDHYHKNVIKANWEYYKPRTEHGSSLSASMYALTACLIGQSDYAYPLFMKSATVDLTGDSKHYAGQVYIGGTHPAASGGAYMTAIYGFTGLSFHHGIQVVPRLPKSITSISYHMKHQNKKYHIKVSKNDYEIKEITYD